MELYFSPMACSLATRIALYEAGARARFIEVDSLAKRTGEGADYWQVNAMGQVPALRTDDGRLITENAAVLQHVGEAFPAAGLLPDDAAARDEVRQWLGFIGTELHKAVFVPLLDPRAPAEVRPTRRTRRRCAWGCCSDTWRAGSFSSAPTAWPMRT